MSWSSSLCNFFQYPVYSSLLDPTPYSRSHQYSTVRPWQPAGSFVPSTDRPTAAERKHRVILLALSSAVWCHRVALVRLECCNVRHGTGNIDGSWRRKFHAVLSCYLTSNSLFINRRSLCSWTSVLGFRHLSPILVPSFRPFVTGSEESGWAPVAGESYSRTLVVQRLSLYGVRPPFNDRMQFVLGPNIVCFHWNTSSRPLCLLGPFRTFNWESHFRFQSHAAQYLAVLLRFLPPAVHSSSTGCQLLHNSPTVFYIPTYVCSSVRLVTRLRFKRPRNRGSIPGRIRGCPNSKAPRPALLPTHLPTSYPEVTWCVFLRRKVATAWSWSLTIIKCWG